MKFTPPFWFIILLLGIVASRIIFPTTIFISFPYNYLGSVLILFGIAVNYWADALFKKKQTTIQPHELPNALVTSGVFRISRNPMYLGMASILVGAAFFIGSFIAFIFPLLFVLYIEIFIIPREEKNLTLQFSQKYLQYKQKVRRWI